MNTKFYGALLTFGLAISGLAKAGTSGDPTPVNIGLVMNAGFTDTDFHFSMLDRRNYEWDQLSGSALPAESAAIDLAMTTPGLFLDQPVGPAPFFGVVVRFMPGYHRGSTTGVVFTDAFK
jgi:hypothetical protein